MNIFEQYGIKDVMDVTLYGITYDKYDNEVYIPMLYFDTLQVSSIEQTAEQTSATGGLGNAEHIIWDYGKAITVTLQDALYTPASQSLIWGGLFGLKNMKIKGYWDPYVYKVDEHGNTVYYEKEVSLVEPEDKDNWIKIICPCDSEIKWITYKQADGRYKYSPEGRFNGTTLSRNNLAVTDQNDNEIIIYTENDFKKSIPEKAEIRVDNFQNFYFNNYQIKLENNKYKIFNSIEGDKKEHSVLEYQWRGCDMKMTTSDTRIDLALEENVIFCYHSFYDNNNKRIIFGNQNEGYKSYLDFYTIVTKIIKDNEGIEHQFKFKVLLGTFYIVEDFNIITNSEEYAIHSIDSNIEKVYYMDTMEQCVAKDNFAIDVDKNILSYNYSQMPEHEQTNLTVYYNPNTMAPYEANDNSFTRKNGEVITGNLHIIKKDNTYLKFTRRRAPQNESLGKRIIVNAKNFPQTFKLVGETYCRSRDDGKDIHYQIEIPLCKLSSTIELPLEADGGPVTVNMTMRVLRQENGNMIKLTQYKKEPIQNITLTKILSPTTNLTYCVEQDCAVSQQEYNSNNLNSTFLRFPEEDEFKEYIGMNYTDFNYTDFASKYKNIILIAEIKNDIITKFYTKDDISTISITYQESDVT